MGKYINNMKDGSSLPARGKANALIAAGAKVTNAVFQPNLVCVVENGPFDAAAFMYSQKEMEEFNDPNDFRPKTWLIVEDAEQLCK